jgi:hypothetical protein
MNGVRFGGTRFGSASMASGLSGTSVMSTGFGKPGGQSYLEKAQHMQIAQSSMDLQERLREMKAMNMKDLPPSKSKGRGVGRGGVKIASTLAQKKKRDRQGVNRQQDPNNSQSMVMDDEGDLETEKKAQEGMTAAEKTERKRIKRIRQAIDDQLVEDRLEEIRIKAEKQKAKAEKMLELERIKRDNLFKSQNGYERK